MKNWLMGTIKTLGIGFLVSPLLAEGHQVLQLKRGKGLNLTDLVHLAFEVRAPKMVFTNFEKQVAEIPSSEIIFSKDDGLKIDPLEKSLILPKGGNDQSILLIPMQEMPMGRYKVQLFFRSKENFPHKFKITSFYTTHKKSFWPKMTPIIIPPSLLYKNLLAQRPHNKFKPLHVCDFKSLQYSCDIFSFGPPSIPTGGENSEKGKKIEVFEQIDEKYPHLFIVIQIDKKNTEIVLEKMTLTRTVGLTYVRLNPKLPNLASKEIFADNTGTLTELKGLRLMTPSEISFKIRLPDSPKNFLQYGLGYVNNKREENFFTFSKKIDVHMFHYEASLLCQGRRFQLENRVFSGNDVEHSTKLFSIKKIPLPDECQNSLAQLTFRVRAREKGKNSYIFLSNPTVMNLDFPKKYPNLLFITADSLRYDHTTLAGYRRNTTPNLNQLKSQGISFRKFFVQRTLTQDSFPVFFTGKYPYQLKSSFYNVYEHIHNNHQFLPQILQDHGFQSRAMVGSEHWGTQADSLLPFDSIYYTPANNKNLIMDSLNWLKQVDSDRPYFLWVHLMRPHLPYAPDERFRFKPDDGGKPLSRFTASDIAFFLENYSQNQKIIDRIIDLYDGNIAQVDSEIMNLIFGIEKIRTLDNTIIVITSDHGENLGEHRHFFQHGTLQNANLHVPLLIIYPRVLPKGKVIDGLVEATDLFPTILDLVQIQDYGKIDGRSFLPLMLGKKVQGKNFTFADFQGKIFSIQNDQWKYIYNPGLHKFQGINFAKTYTHQKDELYRISEDPSERKNLFEDHKEIALQMREKIEYFYRNRFNMEKVDKGIDPNILPLLKRTGYLVDDGS